MVEWSRPENSRPISSMPARRVAIFILREVTGMSMEEIGREFSGRDHSTIVYSLKTMERDMKNDQHLRETVSDIIKNVKA